MSLCACTTTPQVVYQPPQIDAALRVVGGELPKLPEKARLIDVLNNRIDSDAVHNTLMARFRAVLHAIGVEPIETINQP